MEVYIKEDSSMAKRVVMVHKYGRMGVCMRDLGRKGKHPEKEECYLLMVIIMWGIG